MGIYEFHEEDAIRFARDIGAVTRKSRGRELQFKHCPYCHGAGLGNEYTFAINLTTGAHNCKRASCGITGNMIDLARDFGFSLGRDVDEYYNPQRQFKSLRNYPRPTVKDKAVEYFAGRGISEAIVRRYSIGVRNDKPDILVIPFFDEGGIMRFIKYRNTDPKPGESKEWCESGCRPILFGMDQCNPQLSQTLIITEGQIDSMSIAEAYSESIPNVVSVPTGAKGFTWLPYCWDFLSKFETLIVFGDYEHDHITLLDEMSRRFHGVVKHVRSEDYQGCKDANELLVKYGKEAVRKAIECAVFMPVPEIVQIADIDPVGPENETVISTGLRPLDTVIGGFYLGKVILMTGKRGNGKSTLALQFGVEALNQGYNVMVYSGEMTNRTVKNWLDRQLAGRKNIIERKSRMSDHKDYIVADEAGKKIAEWYKERAYLYNSELVTDGREVTRLLEIAKAAITIYGCRMVILDNLMSAILSDMPDERSDMYQKQALFVHRLVDMARMYGVVIILVAHPRKGNLKDFDNDDISGSSNITDQADIILNYATPDECERDSVDRILMVTKNRGEGGVNYNGIPLWFDEPSKRITAVKGMHDKLYGWDAHQDDFVDADAMDIPFD